LEPVVKKAIAWELGRVMENGEIDVTENTRTGLKQEKWQGHYKDVNLSEITFCLLYDHARTGKEEPLNAAKKIVERRKKLELRIKAKTPRRKTGGVFCFRKKDAIAAKY
jgi:hypothetical protein